MYVRFGITSGEALLRLDGRARIDGLPLSFDITTTLQKECYAGLFRAYAYPAALYPEDTRSARIR